MGLAICNSSVNQLGVFWLLGGGEDEGGVGGGILGFVFANGCGELVCYSYAGKGRGRCNSRSWTGDVGEGLTCEIACAQIWLAELNRLEAEEAYQSH